MDDDRRDGCLNGSGDFAAQWEGVGRWGYIDSEDYLSAAELYDPATETWTPTGALNTARDGHTETLLVNGAVLVAGGYDFDYNLQVDVPLSSAETYDPATGTWTTTGTMNYARYGHTATLLRNGYVLIAGGTAAEDTTVYLSSAELYGPPSGTWAATGTLNTPRAYHTGTSLPDGKVLIAGGWNGGELASAEVFDPANETWTTTNALATARDSHTATSLANGKALVAGGFGNSGIVASAELYDPATGAWTTSGSLAAARWLHTATLLPNGQVLAAGGQGTNGASLSSAELYDPATGTWTNTGALNTGRAYHTATLLPSGKVLVAGGEGSGNIYLSSAELDDPATGTWTATGPLNIARGAHTGTLLMNGSVVVAGGMGNRGLPLSSAELFDPATGTWTNTGTLSYPTRGPHGDLVARRERYWSRGDRVTAPPFFPARSCTIQPLGHGRRRAGWPLHGVSIRQPCCPTGRCWPRGVKTAAGILPARSFTTRAR